MKLSGLLLTVALAGCGATTTTPIPGTTTPAVATVSASQAVLAASGRTVLACYSVPACAKVAPKAKIKAAYDVAYKAVTDAQAVADTGGSPDMSLEAAALTTLQSLVAQLPPTT